MRRAARGREPGTLSPLSGDRTMIVLSTCWQLRCALRNGPEGRGQTIATLMLRLRAAIWPV